MTERLVDREVRWLNLNTADITGGQNPAYTGVVGVGVAGGYTNSIDVKTRGRRNEQVIVPSINEVMSANSQLVYCFGFGNAVFPASEFQLLADVDYYDITISYSCADGSSSITYAFNASQSYALPTAQYGFIIWPIVPKTALVKTHGYPLQKTKRLRLEGDADPEDDDGILS